MATVPSNIEIRDPFLAFTDPGLQCNEDSLDAFIAEEPQPASKGATTLLRGPKMAKKKAEGIVKALKEG